MTDGEFYKKTQEAFGKYSYISDAYGEYGFLRDALLKILDEAKQDFPRIQSEKHVFRRNSTFTGEVRAWKKKWFGNGEV